MEERLDDALNVLRNHCEPQLLLPRLAAGGGLDDSYVGTSPIVVPIQSENAVNDTIPPIKLERGNTSKSKNLLDDLNKTFFLKHDLFKQRNVKSHQIQIQNQVVPMKVRLKEEKDLESSKLNLFRFFFSVFFFERIFF